MLRLPLAGALSLACTLALAQVGPGPVPPTPFNGGSLSQPLVTTPATTGAAGLNVAPGTAPTAPNNGDVWATASGMFLHAGGVTTGPVTGAAGSTGQLQENNAGALAGITLGGDCTFATPNITCTKTSGAIFAPSATTDTTNAGNISTGTLGSALLPSPFTSGTASGNTSKFATTTGTLTSGDCVKIDINGNFIDAGAVCAASIPQTLFIARSVNFNSANTDTSIAISLPAGSTNYLVSSVVLANASASISTATFGLFTASGGGGTAILNAQAITVTTSATDTPNNAQLVTPGSAGTRSHNAASLFFRVQTAEGSAATADVFITIVPL